MSSESLGIDPLTLAILDVLMSDASRSDGSSVPRIAKRTGLGASVVLRQLTLASDAMLGGKAGPGWVRVSQQDGRWLAWLTDEGRTLMGRLRADS